MDASASFANPVPKELVWLPPTYRNIEHADQLSAFYEGPYLHRYSFIFYSCVLISSGNEIGPVTNTEVTLDHDRLGLPVLMSFLV